ncbi:hypothetical protein AtDm6_1916 [Acetobacter tropicalis]|uniref:Uncharacterized protein n=1 Tax=Acetobacter tropicalis TaxID=104102 RepID=A0A094YNT6_9PROT|nr:hypothetical protein AtDm6_1916 [Acetobacter tropicalis]
MEVETMSSTRTNKRNAADATCQHTCATMRSKLEGVHHVGG